ncbi:MAG TPA: hypothetical protein VM681_02925, partial [Candidatus Thermoplasmatota archaeon]|nr:hypothetical protein [Candidatus Thermoplasmatota archaeon]
GVGAQIAGALTGFVAQVQGAVEGLVSLATGAKADLSAKAHAEAHAALEAAHDVHVELPRIEPPRVDASLAADVQARAMAAASGTLN